MYLRNDIRERLDNWNPPQNEAELQYVIAKLVDAYISERVPTFLLFNSMIGVLESVKLELYRDVIGKFMEQRKFETGEVFTSDKE